MSISKYLPKEHPTRAIFKKYNVPLSAVSNFTGLTYNYISSMLRGSMPATPDVDAKLHDFAKMVQDEGKKGEEI